MRGNVCSWLIHAEHPRTKGCYDGVNVVGSEDKSCMSAIQFHHSPQRGLGCGCNQIRVINNDSLPTLSSYALALCEANDLRTDVVNANPGQAMESQDVPIAMAQFHLIQQPSHVLPHGSSKITVQAHVREVISTYGGHLLP